MEIGGKDLRFALPMAMDCNRFQHAVLEVAARHWPCMIWEQDDIGRKDVPVRGEWFIYKDQDAVEDWEKDVGPPNTMIYAIYDAGSPPQGTLVVDVEHDEAVRNMIAELQEIFRTSR